MTSNTRTPPEGPGDAGAAPPAPRAWAFERRDATRLLAVVAIACALLLVAMVAELEWDDVDAFGRRDFACFHAAARRALHGEPGLYADRARLFANPPSALPLVLPLALLSPHAAWLACAALTSLGAIGALALAARIGDAGDRATAILVALTAPPLWLAVHLGQLSGLYALALAGSLYAWSRGRETTAGAIAALLCLKPPLALGIVLLAVARRARRFFTGFAIVLGLSLALSVPFGIERWSEWGDGLAILADIHEHAPRSWWKQLGLYALVRWELAPIAGPEIARVAWALITLPLALWVGRCLARAERIDASVVSRVALATVALNLYCFVYDGVLLAIPALLAVRDRRHVSMALAALVWLTTAVLPFAGIGAPLAAPIALAWLIWETWRAARTGTTRTGATRTDATRADDRSPALAG